MKEQRFKVGDTVTYIKRPDTQFGYRYGGECQGGGKGIIKEYYHWMPEADCWSIKVTVPGTIHTYKMLESEFREYLNPPVSKTLNNYSIW